MAFKCVTCQEVCPVLKDFKHKDDCAKKAVVKWCTGSPPHLNASK